MERGAKAPLIL